MAAKTVMIENDGDASPSKLRNRKRSHLLTQTTFSSQIGNQDPNAADENSVEDAEAPTSPKKKQSHATNPHSRMHNRSRTVAPKIITEIAKTKSKEVHRVISLTKEASDVYKILILHELKVCNNLIKTMREDLEQLSVYLKGDEVNSTHSSVLETFDSLQKQATPQKWTRNSFITLEKDSLEGFFRCLLYKYESIKQIVGQLRCEVPPIIPLQKLFDPIHFLTSVLWQYSVQNSVSMFDLEIELYPYKVPPTNKTRGNNLYVTGFLIKGGRIAENNFLDEEYTREYESKMPGFLLKVLHREEPNALHEDEPSVPIHIHSDRLKEKYTGKGEIITAHSKYMKNLLNDEIEELKTVADRTLTETGRAIYPVKLPVVNPCAFTTSEYFKPSFFFYFRSFRPQEYWQSKGAGVFLQI